MGLMKLLVYMIICLNPVCNGQMTSLSDINLSNYSKISAPYMTDKGKTVDVNVSMYILNIGNLNTEDMTFEVEMYFGMKWIDPRLAFKEYNNDNATYAMVKGQAAQENIWMPDIFIRNMKFVEKSRFLMDISGVRIFPNGLVTSSSRIRVVAHCEMDLLMFPLDSQSCDLIIVSYIYSTEVMTMNWAANPVLIDQRRQGKPQENSWKGFWLERTETTTDSYIFDMNGFEFQFLIAKFVMKRQPQYYILRGFIPSSFLVCLTWASFWLPISSYPARIALIVTSFLASIVLYQGSTQNVHQMTMMQVFLFGNISFIVLTLLEYLLAVKIDHKNRDKKQVGSFTNKSYKGSIHHQTNEKETSSSDIEQVNTVDEQARYKIPLIYMVYVAVFVAAFLLNIE